MSRLENATGGLHHVVDGPASGPALVLLNSLGTTLDLWEPQLPALVRHFRVLRFDYPGHGGSAPDDRPWSLEGLGDGLCEVLDQLGWERASLCGISLGGMVAISLAARRPERVAGLVAACSSAQMSPGQYWLDRAERVRAGGLEPLREQVLERWFSPGFMAAEPGMVARFGERLTEVDPGSYAAACEALARADLTAQLSSIRAPTLILAGALDQASSPLRGLELQSAIPDAGLRVLAGAGHLANLEQPATFAGAVLGQLTGGQFSRGDLTRRRVLGEEHVERVLAGATPFTADFQDLITRYAWGEIWARPGLDLFTRRCITIALLVSLGRWDELALHVRSAVAAELSQEQVAEVLLQTAIYCGVPAANAAFDRVQRALSQSDQGE